MHILVINFTAETTSEQFDNLVKDDAPVFAEIEGLIHKNFIFNHEEKNLWWCLYVRKQSCIEGLYGG